MNRKYRKGGTNKGSSGGLKEMKERNVRKNRRNVGKKQQRGATKGNKEKWRMEVRQ